MGARSSQDPNRACNHGRSQTYLQWDLIDVYLSEGNGRKVCITRTRKTKSRYTREFDLKARTKTIEMLFNSITPETTIPQYRYFHSRPFCPHISSWEHEGESGHTLIVSRSFPILYHPANVPIHNIICASAPLTSLSSITSSALERDRHRRTTDALPRIQLLRIATLVEQLTDRLDHLPPCGGLRRRACSLSTKKQKRWSSKKGLTTRGENDAGQQDPIRSNRTTA